MLREIKHVVRRALTSWPLVSAAYYRWAIAKAKLDEKQLRGRIQQVGHSLDLQMSAGQRPAEATVRELEHLLAAMGRRGLAMDEAVGWAARLLVVATYGLRAEARAPTGPATARADVGSGPADVLTGVLTGRRSVRKWTPDRVRPEDLHPLIEIAKWAPSSCNRQLWQTLLVEDPDEKQFLGLYFPNKFYLQAPLLVVVLMNTGLYGGNEKHFAYLDGAAFIQNLLLVLHVRGYGACWVGFKAWDAAGGVFVPREQYDRFYERFNLDKALVPISMVAVGRPAATPEAPPRQGLGDIVVGHAGAGGGSPRAAAPDGEGASSHGPA